MLVNMKEILSHAEKKTLCHRLYQYTVCGQHPCCHRRCRRAECARYHRPCTGARSCDSHRGHRAADGRLCKSR